MARRQFTSRVRGRALVIPACLAVAALALVGCGQAAPTAAGPGATTRTGAALAVARVQVPPGLGRFYGQRLQWAACPEQWAIASGVTRSAARAAKLVTGYQCAWLTVPLDYQDPGGVTLRLAMNRLPATDPASRSGELLTNPGGPGGSGVGFGFTARTYFSAQLRAHFDIVGMDPRGVGLSSPVRCPLGADDHVRADDHVVDATLATAEDVARACQRSAGSLIPYVGTDNAARDLDIARSALGEATLDYYGGSYGTLLGLTYAHMFPHNVGRMVLDSVDAPKSGTSAVEQAESFESTFDYMVSTCVTLGAPCPMGSSARSALVNYSALQNRLKAAPVPLVTGKLELTSTLLAVLVTKALYGEAKWPTLWTFLGQLIRGTVDATDLVKLLKAAHAGSDNDVQSYDAIFCPTLPSDQRTIPAARAAIRLAEQAAPHFGAVVAGSRIACAVWPVPSPADAGQPLNAPGAPTILLVGNDYDPATPVTWAREVHAELPNSVLVTNQAGGHGFYPMGPCTHAVVDDFLISLTLPAAGSVCHDRSPVLTEPVPVTG